MSESDMYTIYILVFVVMAVLYVAAWALRAVCWFAGKFLDYMGDRMYEFRDWWHAGGIK